MQADRVVLPERAGSREEARDLLAILDPRLDGRTVTVDGEGLEASSSSFIDELIKLVLVDRNAARLQLTGATPRVAFFATSAAQRRGTEARLSVKTK